MDKLDAEELAWLNKFTEEYNNASFKHDDSDIQSYEKYGKDSNDRNNSRNRCLYGILRNQVNGYLKPYEAEIEEGLSLGVNPKNLENTYVDFLDYTHVELMLQEYDTAMFTFTEETE